MGELPQSTSKRLLGHPGHLTADQEAALDTFKSRLEKASLYTQGTETSKPSHDEATLLRFLRARRFDPEKAEKQFSDTLAWRKAHDVDNLFANFDTDEFEASRRFYPRWTGRRDKQGMPVYVYKIASLGPIQHEIHATSSARRYQRIIVLEECMLRLVFPLCTFLPHVSEPTPVSSVTTIIDLEGASLRQMWGLRNHLQEASVLTTANYPETLNTIAIVNAPSFFPTIWGWIKGWFDEGTREKIHILGRDPGETLRTLIDAKHFPKTYGGELDWTFCDDPSLDDAAKGVLGEMPKGPVVFVDGEVKRPAEYKMPLMMNGNGAAKTNTT